MSNARCAKFFSAAGEEKKQMKKKRQEGGRKRGATPDFPYKRLLIYWGFSAKFSHLSAAT